MKTRRVLSFVGLFILTTTTVTAFGESYKCRLMAVEDSGIVAQQDKIIHYRFGDPTFGSVSTDSLTVGKYTALITINARAGIIRAFIGDNDTATRENLDHIASTSTRSLVNYFSLSANNRSNQEALLECAPTGSRFSH